ncbi:MAG: response regulator [Thermoproteota archaeon]|nr:response regulator [Thermoproteota archaeon]
MKAKVLVVDDEPDVTYTLKATLEATGFFDIYMFNEPSLALSNFRPNTYDLVILDIRMPQMNGFELLNEIKKIDENVKVCFLTAVSELTEYKTSIKKILPALDENYIIRKPIDNIELVRQLNQILNPRSKSG